MGNNQPYLRKNHYLFIISLLTLITFIILFLSRSLDDNRLTSWQWAFQKTDASDIFLIITAGIFLSFIISKISFRIKSPAIFLFLISFVIASVFWGVPEVIVDSSRYFTQAKHLEIYGVRYFVEEWGKNIDAWTDMPLIPLLYGLIFKFFGENRIYIQIFTTTLFSMTVVITYLIGRRLWDEDTGFIGGALLLGMPYLLTQAPLMLVDVPTMFFLMLSVFAFIKAMETGGWFNLFSAFTIALAFFSKYSAWMMLSVLVIISLVYITKGSGIGRQGAGSNETINPEHVTRKYFLRGSLIALFSIILIGIVFLYKFDVFMEQVRFLITYQKPGLKRWEEGFLSTFFFQIHPFITAAALSSLYIASKKKDLKYAIIIWMVLLVVLLQIKRIRYIIMVFPLVSLMASYGLKEIAIREVKKFIVSCAVTSSIIVAVFSYLPFLKEMSAMNLKQAGEFLNSTDDSNIEVFTILPADPVGSLSVSVPILDLFTGKNIIYKYDDKRFRPPKEEIERSSLRFTWEYRNPRYYSENGFSDVNTPIALVSEDAEKELPEDIRRRLEGYYLSKVFGTYEGIFQYRTTVRIYHKKPE